MIFSPEAWRRKRIGVLMGGMSDEREVSLLTGRAVLKALIGLGYPALPIEADQELPRRLVEERIEVAFIGLHGRLGEDGTVQGLLEVMGIPYTGSGVLASALAMDKAAARKIFLHHGLPGPPFVVWSKRDRENFHPDRLPFPLPVVVKPSQEGSSVGITVVREASRAEEALAVAFAFGPEVLIEAYIPGREIQVGILEDAPLGAIEIVPRVEFYNYEAKYTAGLADHLLPAPLPAGDYERALQLGLQAHRALGCEGASRVDLLYRDGQFFLLEVNTLPGMTNLSLLPEIARGAGISFPQLVERILLGARLRIRAGQGGKRSG